MFLIGCFSYFNFGPDILLCEKTRFFAQQYFVNFYFSRSVTLTIFVLEFQKSIRNIYLDKIIRKIASFVFNWRFLEIVFVSITREL